MSSSTTANTGIRSNRTTADWQSRVEGPREREVFEALSDPRWEFRTIEGISRQTKLPPDEVERTLKDYAGFVRKSLVPDHRARDLYTLRSRPITRNEILAAIRTFVTKSL